MAERRGLVWYGNRRVGALREDDSHSLHFAYDPAWLADGGFPVSVLLPLSLGDREVEAHGFFEGLLPEGPVRQRICRQLGIDFRDDTGLLLAIGEDCAGALSILPADVMPEETPHAPVRLSRTAVDRMVYSHGADMPTVDGGRQRFSLAGAQEKQPVIYDGQSYALPDRANPSSHILKFETIPRVCFAEYAANRMAKALALPVVETEYLLDGVSNAAIPCLRIRRFDRLHTSGQLLRLHQEDIVQALGLSSLLKYQSDGGPALSDVAHLLRAHTARPVEALAHLRDWQVFNCLIGNWDGHGKNLALLYEPGEVTPSLAPFYDLVAIELLNLVRPNTYARDLAFAVGSHYVPEQITRADWEALARDLGMPARRVLARLEEWALQLPDICRAARAAFAAEHGDEAVYDKLEESVRRRCKWTLNSLAGRKS